MLPPNEFLSPFICHESFAWIEVGRYLESRHQARALLAWQRFAAVSAIYLLHVPSLCLTKAFFRSKLPLLRRNDQTEYKREGSAEVDAVSSLPQAGIPSATSKSGFAGVRAMNARRRGAHDQAEADWDKDRKAYYALVEGRVLDAGRALRGDLSGLDSSVAESTKQHSQREVLEGMQLQDVHDMLKHLMRLHDERDARVAAFEAFLDSVESGRAQELGARLQRFVHDSTGIGHKLVTDIERWVESEAHDINMLVVRNRQDAASTIAALRTAGVKARSAAKRGWRRDVLTAWRSAKHDAALARTVQHLNSTALVNPPTRVEAVERLREQTAARHAQRRLPLLQELLSLRPAVLSTPGTDEVHGGPTLDLAAGFSAASVAGVQDALAELSLAEQTEQARGFEAVQTASAQVLASADAHLQELRWELHHYAALSPPAGVPLAAAALRTLLDDESLVSVFRRGGGLKGELASLVAESDSRAVVNSSTCADMQARAEVLLAAAPLGGAMEAAGRAATRTAALETVDALRTARRGAIPALLGTLLAQLVRVVGTPGLSDGLLGSLHEAQEALLEIAHEVALAMGAAGMSVPDSLAAALGIAEGGDGGDGLSVGRGTTPGSTAHRSARSVKFSAASGVRGEAPPPSRGAPRSMASRGGAAGSGGSVSGRTARSGMASQMTDRLSAALASALPVAELRRAGRRLGLLLAFTELPPAASDALRGLSSALDAQKTANAAVDAAVQTSVQPVLARRQDESAAFLRRLGLALQGQSETLAEAADNLCTWMQGLAAAVHLHVQREVQLDTVTAAALRHAEHDFKARGQALEECMERHLFAVRTAGNDETLAKRNVTALQQLDVIEEHYRDMHSAVTALASAHPKHVAMHARALRRQLCERFTLVFPRAHVIDGVAAISQDAAEAAAAAHARGVWVTRMRRLVEEEVAQLPPEEGVKPVKGGSKSKPGKGGSKPSAPPPVETAGEGEGEDALDTPADLQDVSAEELAGLQWAYDHLQGGEESEEGRARRTLDAAVERAQAGVLEEELQGATGGKDPLDWGPGNMDLEFGDPD
jgi:hypothetical protein